MSTNYLYLNPLPSWSKGMSKKAIIDFMESGTSEGKSTCVPPMNRMAVFDINSTL
jgi:hypothetical protein